MKNTAKKYESPEISLALFEVADIITTSYTDEEDEWGLPEIPVGGTYSDITG